MAEMEELERIIDVEIDRRFLRNKGLPITLVNPEDWHWVSALQWVKGQIKNPQPKEED